MAQVLQRNLKFLEEEDQEHKEKERVLRGEKEALAKEEERIRVEFARAQQEEAKVCFIFY